MSTADIGDTEGVNKLITKLDELYKEDKNQAAFLAYEQFEQFKRPENMKVKDYINAFERLNNKIKAYDMVLPEGFLAYGLLRSANLTQVNEQLARATIKDLTYRDMCNQLKTIFGDSIIDRSGGEQGIMRIPKTEIKSEPTYYENNWKDVFYDGTNENQGYNSIYRGGGHRGSSGARPRQP